MSSSENIGIVVLIIDTQNHTILLGERVNSYKSGNYGLPGGRIERKEALIEAATRELLEETAIQVEDTNLIYLGVVRELQDTYNFIHFAYLVKDIEQIPQNTEPNKCKGWERIEIDKLPKNILRGHQAVIDLYTQKRAIEDLL